MLPAFLLPLATALVATSAPPAPAVVAAYATPGAVVFDLDLGRQVTIVLDDDGVALDRISAPRPGLAQGPTLGVLPESIDRVDVSDDGRALVVRSGDRAVTIPLAER